VLTVGDISGQDGSVDILESIGLRGVSYLELFGIGGPWADEACRRIEAVHSQIDSADRLQRVYRGVEPHAPYSAGRPVYRAAAVSGLPCTTHLAEMQAERQFIAGASGPFRALLQRLGKWEDRFARDYSEEQSPVQWMEQHLRAAPWLCAHCNQVSDDDVALLAEAGASVVYCPRAAAYFGHRAHRWREMLDAGVNVCLGTDSIICHGSLSVLDEMRFLYHQGAEAEKLLAMATIAGMRGLSLDPTQASFVEGAEPGLIGLQFDPTDPVDPLEQVLGGDVPGAIEVYEMPGAARRIC
jgi:cytosine/adenosine deaminase-related metal-dependent hydrolase